MPSAADDLRARYVHQRELGAGGMGRVELVLDRARGELVARKRITHPTGLSLLRFKSEFRAVAHLRHPNLVGLYELGQDDAGLFITMEAVDGVDLATYCGVGTEAAASDADGSRLSTTSSGGQTHERELTRRAIADDALLAKALPQLLDALAFLHDHGVAHCDLKPSNVMVRRDGVLKLLDFGISSRFGAHEEPELAGRTGTPAYLAPEVASGERPSAASDVYALGVVLAELHSGLRPKRPHSAPTKRETESPVSLPTGTLASVRADLPAAVHEILGRMLAIAPALRPTLAEIAEAYGAHLTLAPRAKRTATRGLVGRDRETAELVDHLGRCYDGAFAAVALAGATGVGKSSLARDLARTAERGGAIALRGHAHLRERVAFNGVDDAVDALAKRLLADRGDASLDEPIALASALFPALASLLPDGRVPVLADRAKTFAAFVRLLEQVAARAGALVLIVDDLQWADADAAGLLGTLLQRAPARVMLLATVRDDLPSTGPGGALLGAGLVTLKVDALDDEALAELVVGALEPDLQARLDSETVARVVRMSAGRPVLADLAVRAILEGASEELGPTAALAKRLATLGPLALRVVATLVAADGWLDAETLEESLGEPRALIDEALVALERKGIVRLAASGARGHDAALFHDVIRAAASSAIAPEELRAAHGGLCDVLARRPGEPDERIVRHLLAAGRVREAAKRAANAGRGAFEKFAYGLAADLLDIARLDPEVATSAVLELHARALDLSGRYAEAAVAYAALAATQPEAEARPAKLAEATALLYAGDAARGRTKLFALLKETGELPRSILTKLFALVLFLFSRAPIVASRPALGGAPTSAKPSA